MLSLLEEIFNSGTIEENEAGTRIALNSATPKEQGMFIQNIFDIIQPARSVEVGFALGISTLFILEKCRQYDNEAGCHIVIEPFSWGDAGMHNISKAGLEKYISLRNDFSDVILPTLYLNKERIQLAYIDTTKVFDTVLQDFYFIDKILDIGGVVIIDDATVGGVKKVVRFVNSLPHYEVFDKFEKTEYSRKALIKRKLIDALLFLIPFKKYLSIFSLKTSAKLGLEYRCIAFRKIDRDSREWNWDAQF